MARDITIGQFYQTESVVHRLDPRVKLVATIAFLVSLFLIRNYSGYLVAAFFFCSVVALSHVPPMLVIRGLRPILFLMIFTLIFNLLLTPGEVIFSWWKIEITREALEVSAKMALRLSFLVMGSSIMTLTTTPNNLTDGLEKLLRPLRYIGIPVHEVAMMMSIALRFIPILVEEADKIKKAQMARGANFDEGGIFQRAKSLLPLLVPLFVSAFRRANDLAMAMEARCYRGGDGRTKMKPLRYAGRDYTAYLILVIYLVAAFCAGRMLPY